MNPMSVPPSSTTWPLFQQINRSRRAVRDFATTPIAREDLDALLAEACLAPSSLGLQPYALHVVESGEVKTRLAAACNGQKAARTAASLVVVVTGPGLTRQRVAESHAHYQTDSSLPQSSRDYHLKELQPVALVHRWWLLPLLAIVRGLLVLLSPTRSLIPLGGQGLRQWAARSAMLAAQTLMLAASARGIDSCPMEGFRSPDVANILNLPYGVVPVLVIALGYRAENARIEPQWRRPPEQMIHRH